jgi:hypothetical protein
VGGKVKPRDLTAVERRQIEEVSRDQLRPPLASDVRAQARKARENGENGEDRHATMARAHTALRRPPGALTDREVELVFAEEWPE